MTLRTLTVSLVDLGLDEAEGCRITLRLIRSGIESGDIVIPTVKLSTLTDVSGEASFSITPNETGSLYQAKVFNTSGRKVIDQIFDMPDSDSNLADLVDLSDTEPNNVLSLVYQALSDVTTFITPKDEAFGAVGDWTVNDTAALHLCINYAATYGRDVVVPKGGYKATHFCVGWDATLNPDYPATPKPFRIIFEGSAGNAAVDYIESLSDTQYMPGAWIVQHEDAVLDTPLIYFRRSSSGVYNNRGIEITGLKAVARTTNVVLDGKYVWEWKVRGLRVKNIHPYGNGYIIDNFEKCIFEDWMSVGAKDTTTYPVESRGGVVGGKFTYQDIDGSSTQIRNMLMDKWTTGYVEGEQAWSRSYTFAASGKTITDNTSSDSMFGAIRVGDLVTISSSSSNNGTFTVTARNAGGTQITVAETLVDETTTAVLEHNNGYEFHNHDVKQSILTTNTYFGAVLGGQQTGQTYIGCQFRGKKRGLQMMGKQHSPVFNNLDCAWNSSVLAGSIGLHIGAGPTSALNNIRSVQIHGLFAQKNQYLVKVEGTGGIGSLVKGIHIAGAELNVTNTSGYAAFYLNGSPNQMTLRSVDWNGTQSLFTGSGSVTDIRELIDVGKVGVEYYDYELNGVTLKTQSSVDHSFVGGGVSDEGIVTVSTTTTTSSTLNVTAAANNGVGLIRLTVNDHGFVTGESVAVASVGGVPDATGTWTVTRINTNQFDLQGSTWAGTYTSGGTAILTANGIDLDNSGSTSSRGYDNYLICSKNGGTLRYMPTTTSQAGDSVRIRFSHATPPTLVDTDDSDGIRVIPYSPGVTTRAILQGEVLCFVNENSRWHLQAGG